LADSVEHEEELQGKGKFDILALHHVWNKEAEQ
jgi:hypothetical protein